MKKKITSLALLSLIAALPAHAAGTPIPSEKLATYLEALEQGGALDLPCYFGGHIGTVSLRDYSIAGRDMLDINGNNPYVALTRSTEGTLDASGAQPVITLTNKTDYGSGEVEFAFSTSSDYRRVTNIDIRFKDFGPVNHGTIVAPQEVNEYYQTSSYSCN